MPILRSLLHAKVIFVSKQPEEMIRNFRMIPAGSLEEALAMARFMTTEDATISAIPDGVSLIVTKGDE